MMTKKAHLLTLCLTVMLFPCCATTAAVSGPEPEQIPLEETEIIDITEIIEAESLDEVQRLEELDRIREMHSDGQEEGIYLESDYNLNFNEYLDNLHSLDDVVPEGSEEGVTEEESASLSEEQYDEEMHQSDYCEPVSIPPYYPLDIDYPDHPLVLKYHAEYQTNYSQQWLKQTLERAAPYRPYIRKRLQELGMPACLEYLPVIESNYKIKAVSKSGASGLWQFMTNSIAGLLTMNSWYDERYDPWLSTEAALKKLKQNYDMFGDWGLALAAYNMGANGLKKIMAQSGCTTIWELIDGNWLRTETKLYFPKFLAVSDLCTNPEYYELDLPLMDEEAAMPFAMVYVESQVSLQQLSDASGVALSDLLFLNPALTYPVTPYNQSYNLRVPAESEEAVITALNTMERLEADIYVVEKGDSLWGISRRNGITVDELCSANNIKENDILRIGQKLFVPIKK